MIPVVNRAMECLGPLKIAQLMADIEMAMARGDPVAFKLSPAGWIPRTRGGTFIKVNSIFSLFLHHFFTFSEAVSITKQLITESSMKLFFQLLRMQPESNFIFSSRAKNKVEILKAQMATSNNNGAGGAIVYTPQKRKLSYAEAVSNPRLNN